MAKSILDLKGEAYDTGRRLQELQKEADTLVKRNREINTEIDKREKVKT